MRHLLKCVAEYALARASRLSSVGRRASDKVVILAYHNIVPAGQRISGCDSSLHLSQEEFSRQLDVLQETHSIVPLESVFLPGHPEERPRAAITFDDAYEGALSAGVGEVVRRDLPATVFVSPGILGQQMWWDLLAHQDSPSREARRFLLTTLGGDREAVLAWAAQTGKPLRSCPFRIANETEVLAAARHPGIALGSHTWSHRNLSVLTGAELETELIRPLEWLGARLGTQEWSLSYPYGSYSAHVERAAAAAGYAMALRVDGGACPRSTRARHALPRVNIPAGLSLDGFRLRLAGLTLQRSFSTAS